MAIDFDTELHIDGVNTGISLVGTFETRFGFITAIHLDSGPTIACPAVKGSNNMQALGRLIEAHLLNAYREEIEAEMHQQARDAAETRPYRAARDRVYADLMGIPAL